jgi:short-subunit dehydrogenase
VGLVSGNVLLTGASGGIGQAIARALAARGARLLLTGRRLDVLEPLAAQVSGRALQCDLSDRAQVDRLIAEALAANVDVLIGNAALPASGMLTDLTQDQIDRMIEINLRAPIALARGLAGAMMQRGRGHMVFVSSLSGLVVSPASSIYSATKFGLRGFALAAREDLRPYGVGVSVVLPGFIREAGMFADAHVQLPRGVGTRAPEDVARGVIAAIERNRAEVEIAPPLLRLGSRVGAVTPELTASVKRLLGGDQVASNVSEGQRNKR